MSNYSSKPSGMKDGLPPPRKAAASFNFLLLFIVVAIIFAVAIVILQSFIVESGAALQQSGLNRIPEQTIMSGILAMLVGSVQAWILRSKIMSRIPLFVAFALLGGLVGGFFGGLVVNIGAQSPWLIGAIIGGISGVTSSLLQNSVMRNRRYSSRWLLYSTITWLVLFSIGWAIGWKPQDAVALALAAVLMIVGSGVGLALFLKQTPEIEFD